MSGNNCRKKRKGMWIKLGRNKKKAFFWTFLLFSEIKEFLQFKQCILEEHKKSTKTMQKGKCQRFESYAFLLLTISLSHIIVHMCSFSHEWLLYTFVVFIFCFNFSVVLHLHCNFFFLCACWGCAYNWKKSLIGKTKHFILFLKMLWIISQKNKTKFSQKSRLQILTWNKKSKCA